MNWIEIEDQRAELLPARTVLQGLPIPGLEGLDPSTIFAGGGLNRDALADTVLGDDPPGTTD